ARRASLKARGIKDRIMHRANKHQPTLPPWQKRRNQLIAKTRARVERTFAIWQRTYGYTRVRYFTLVANAFELQMKCFAFNLRRPAPLSPPAPPPTPRPGRLTGAKSRKGLCPRASRRAQIGLTPYPNGKPRKASIMQRPPAGSDPGYRTSCPPALRQAS